MYKQVSFEYNTPEWHEFRKDKIGASDFAILAANAGLTSKMSFTPSNAQLWLKKQKGGEQDNYYTQSGKDFEIEITPHIQEIFPDAIPMTIQSLYDARHMASLDFYSKERNTIIEVKWTSKSIFNIQAWKDMINYYTMQIHHQRYIIDDNAEAYMVIFSAADNTIYIYYLCGDVYHYISCSQEDFKNTFSTFIPPTNIHMINYNAMTIQKWKEICDNYFKMIDNNLDHKEAALEVYFKTKKEIEEKENYLKELQKIILQDVTDTLIYKNYIIKKCNRVGSVDYKRLLTENNITIDESQYRKAGSEYFTIQCKEIE